MPRSEEEELKKCLLCLRVPLEKFVSYAQELYEDEKVAQRIAEKAAKLIRSAYLMSPPELCGKNPSGLMAGALYIAGIMEQSGDYVSQTRISEVVGVTTVTIKNRYYHLANLLEIDLSSFEKVSINNRARYYARKGNTNRMETKKQKREVVKNASKWARQILIPGERYQIGEIFRLLAEKARKEGLIRIKWWISLPDFEIMHILESGRLIEARENKREINYGTLLEASSLCKGKLEIVASKPEPEKIRW